MKKEHQEILNSIKQQLEEHPDLRFTQVLFNLNINQKPPDKPFEGVLRDNYGDQDDVVLKRIKERLKDLSS